MTATYRESRIAGAKNEVLPVAGEDVTKAAPIAGVVSSGSKAAALQAGLALCCESL